MWCVGGPAAQDGQLRAEVRGAVQSRHQGRTERQEAPCAPLPPLPTPPPPSQGNHTTIMLGPGSEEAGLDGL